MNKLLVIMLMATRVAAQSFGLDNHDGLPIPTKQIVSESSPIDLQTLLIDGKIVYIDNADEIPYNIKNKIVGGYNNCAAFYDIDSDKIYLIADKIDEKFNKLGAIINHEFIGHKLFRAYIGDGIDNYCRYILDHADEVLILMLIDRAKHNYGKEIKDLSPLYKSYLVQEYIAEIAENYAHWDYVGRIKHKGRDMNKHTFHEDISHDDLNLLVYNVWNSYSK